MKLQLFHLWQCPYSARVRDFIDEQGLQDEIEYTEISEVDGAEAQLVELTGGSQVPCLAVEGKPMLESADIVAWLQANLASPDGSRA